MARDSNGKVWLLCYRSDAAFEYSRSGNPTRNVLETCLASLDNAKYGLTFSSGLGATTCIISSLKAGDHMIAGNDLNGGTNRLICQVAIPRGIAADFIDLTNLELLEKTIKSNTKIVWALYHRTQTSKC